MSALDGWIDICRAGTWRDMAGRAVSLDQDRLDRIVAGHAAADPAPVVVGHPETDAPAYAWVDALRRVGDRLQARLRDVAPSFREAVEAGRYSGRSIALEGDRLRHVGFLGGRAPAVPGLAPTRFGRAPETVVAFEGDESDAPSLASALSAPEGSGEESDTPDTTADDTGGDGHTDETQDDGGVGSLDDPRPPHPDPLRTHGPTGDEDGASLVPLSAPEGRGGDGAARPEAGARQTQVAGHEEGRAAQQSGARARRLRDMNDGEARHRGKRTKGEAAIAEREAALLAREAALARPTSAGARRTRRLPPMSRPGVCSRPSGRVSRRCSPRSMTRGRGRCRWRRRRDTHDRLRGRRRQRGADAARRGSGTVSRGASQACGLPDARAHAGAGRAGGREFS